MSAHGDWFDNQTRDQLKRWQNPGDITNVRKQDGIGWATTLLLLSPLNTWRAVRMFG